MAEFDPDFFTNMFQLTKTLHRDPHDDLLPSNPSNSQKGKIIIVTGAYGGIGSAAASVWARAGASVVLTGRKPDELAKVEKDIKAAITEPSAKVLSVTVDVTVESQVKHLYDQIQNTFGRSADVLFNNAGAGMDPTPVAQLPWDDFATITNSHYLGSVLTSKYFITSQATPADPQGTIIFISSGLSSVVQPGFSPYSIAKLAGQRLIEYLHAEYPRLRTFTLAPGIIITGMTNEFFMPYAKDHIDMPGMMALYLAQERADFLRGGFVNINWDIKELEANKAEIVEKNLLKLQWLPAEFGKGGHPFGES